MAGYFGTIEKQTLKNEYFRQVLYTGKYTHPNHPDKTIHKTKTEAEKAEAEEHH